MIKFTFIGLIRLTAFILTVLSVKYCIKTYRAVNGRSIWWLTFVAIYSVSLLFLMCFAKPVITIFSIPVSIIFLPIFYGLYRIAKNYCNDTEKYFNKKCNKKRRQK